MVNVSVVVITLNEEHNIEACIRSAVRISNDIIVVDTGSTDNTRQIAAATGARVFDVEWKGYGHARNFGAYHAVNDWIFAMDADERISDVLTNSVCRLRPQNESTIYRFRRRNHLSGRRIHFGTPGFESVTRIYNRRFAQWDQSLVHEKLSAQEAEIETIKGYINHFGLKDEVDYAAKMGRYAGLSANKYFSEGKSGGALKRFFSPAFNAAKSYLWLLGFLDGRTGFIVAKMIARYSWLKYHHLHKKRVQHSHCASSFMKAPQANSG